MLMAKHIDAGIACMALYEHGQEEAIRLDRILDIRRKMISGEYNPAEYLDIAVDRLLEEILEERPENQDNM